MPKPTVQINGADVTVMGTEIPNGAVTITFGSTSVTLNYPADGNSHTFTNVPAGNYTMTITWNGGSVSGPFTIESQVTLIRSGDQLIVQE